MDASPTPACHLVRVAGCELLKVEQASSSDEDPTWCIELRTADQQLHRLEGSGSKLSLALADALSELCYQKFKLLSEKNELREGQFEAIVEIEELADKRRSGFGRSLSHTAAFALTIAILRAINNAGLLKPAFRANNQKALRQIATEIVRDLADIESLGQDTNLLQVEGLLLEHLNRVASAAVITAANSPRPDSILSLFDTSAWLFDARGQRRAAYTETDLWLAWYPGIDNDDLTVDEVIDSMPASPETAIPWIVKLFENPSSWLRFRGAVDLEDHDVLHALLGRGLQDQDEAFVLGFAMGTAKRVGRLEKSIFKFVLHRLYPEPYRIPRYLQPAFDLGIECGQQTGMKNLYRQPLKDFRSMTLGEARKACEIDMRVLRQFFEREQERIPFTIASLRLP